RSTSLKKQTPILYASGIFSALPNYDVSAHGQRFVMIKASEEAVPTQINVIQNWFEELKRLAPTDN
ncbi:hypothetical protein MYX75_04420, partial [Acidobacteria bacterium AH-259-A15]|nr:hypothetical protein [Acidobacteria bacterium AH-259-A15]